VLSGGLGASPKSLFLPKARAVEVLGIMIKETRKGLYELIGLHGKMKGKVMKKGSLKDVQKRERQIQYFKHLNK